MCLVIDLAGDAGYLLPFIGEATDGLFAPAEALALRALFGSVPLAAFGFAEEILPFTDVIPAASIGWLLSSLFYDTWPAKLLGVSREEEEDAAPAPAPAAAAAATATAKPKPTEPAARPEAEPVEGLASFDERLRRKDGRS